MDQQQRHPVITNADVYERDLYEWCLTTAALVREGQWDAIDPAALAEELESLGKSQKRELEHRVEVLVMHLLKWEHQPWVPPESHSWYDTIVEQRAQIARVLRDNPSLRRHVPAILLEVYPIARQRAVVAMGALGPSQGRRVNVPEERRRRDPQDLIRGSPVPMTCP